MTLFLNKPIHVTHLHGLFLDAKGIHPYHGNFELPSRRQITLYAHPQHPDSSMDDTGKYATYGVVTWDCPALNWPQISNGLRSRSYSDVPREIIVAFINKDIRGAEAYYRGMTRAKRKALQRYRRYKLGECVPDCHPTTLLRKVVA